MNVQRNILVVMSVVLITLTGCQQKSGKSTTTYLLFAEQEASGSPYQTRVLVSKDFMRFDDGAKSQDFILFDRKQDKIYSVTANIKQALVISRVDTKITPPTDLKLAERQLEAMKDAPSIDGKTPLHYQLMVKDKVCHDVVSVPDLMPDYLEAIREFNLILASDTVDGLANIPADVRDDCELARTVYAPNRHLQFGFPIQEWTKGGFRRTLMDYKNDYSAEANVFTIPDDYTVVTIDEIRNR